MNALLERISGALQSPTAQGLAGAAVLGFNPLLGLVAGPAIAQGRRRAETRQSAAELELEAATEELAQARSQRQARESLPAMLAQLTGAQPDAMVGPPRPGQVREADARNGLMAALAQAAPDAFTQGVMAQAFPSADRGTATQRDFAAYLAMSPEERTAFMAFKNPADPSQALENRLTQLRIDQALAEAEQRRQEAAAATEAEETAGRVETATSEELAAEARTALKELDELENTPLDVGSSEIVSDAIRALSGVTGTVAGAAGLPQGAAINETNQAYDNLGKTLARLRQTAVDAVVGENATNAERAAAAEGFPTMSMNRGAIRSGLRTFFENQVRQLEAQNAPESAIKPFRDLLEDMDSVTVEFD